MRRHGGGGRDVERRTLPDPWRGAVCTVAVGAATGTGLEEVSKPHSPKPQASRLQTADSGQEQEQVQVQVQTSPLHHRSIWRRVVTCGRRPTFVPVGTHARAGCSRGLELQGPMQPLAAPVVFFSVGLPTSSAASALCFNNDVRLDLRHRCQSGHVVSCRIVSCRFVVVSSSLSLSSLLCAGRCAVVTQQACSVRTYPEAHAMSACSQPSRSAHARRPPVVHAAIIVSSRQAGRLVVNWTDCSVSTLSEIRPPKPT